MTSTARKRNVNADAIDLLDEAGAPRKRHLLAVLARLVYWTPYATVVIDGEDYVVKSLAALAKEVRIPEDTVRKHLTQLRRLGLVETRYKMFYGMRTSHHRIVKNKTPGSEWSHPGDQLMVAPEGPPSGPTQETIRRSDQVDTIQHHTHTRRQTRRAASDITMDKFGRGEDAIVRDDPTLKNLLRAWEVAYRKTYPHAPVDGFDPKKTNLLRAFARECADPMGGIFLAVGRWSQFRDRIRRIDGAHSPDLPRMETLHKRVGILNAWLAEEVRGPRIDAYGFPVVG